MTLLEIPVIGGDGEVGATRPSRGRPARVGRASGSVRRAGAVRMNAPGGARGVSSVQENPKGAAGLSEIRRFRIGQTPGRRPEAVLLTEGRGGQKRVGGIAATPVAVAVRDEVLRRGTPQGRGRGGGRLPVEDGGLRAIRRRGVSLPLNLRARGAETLRQWIASGAATHCGPKTTEALERRKNPMDGSSPRWLRSVRGGNRRGGGKPRGRNVPGRQPPGDTDPHACVVEGAVNPRRGVPDREIGDGTRGGSPERGPSLRESLRAPARGSACDGRPRGRGDGVEGAANQ